MPGLPELPIVVSDTVRQTENTWNDKPLWQTQRGPKPKHEPTGEVPQAWIRLIEGAS